MFYGVMRGENSGKTVLFLWLAIKVEVNTKDAVIETIMPRKNPIQASPGIEYRLSWNCSVCKQSSA